MKIEAQRLKIKKLSKSLLLSYIMVGEIFYQDNSNNTNNNHHLDLEKSHAMPQYNILPQTLAHILNILDVFFFLI